MRVLRTKPRRPEKVQGGKLDACEQKLVAWRKQGGKSNMFILVAQRKQGEDGRSPSNFPITAPPTLHLGGTSAFFIRGWEGVPAKVGV